MAKKEEEQKEEKKKPEYDYLKERQKRLKKKK